MNQLLKDLMKRYQRTNDVVNDGTNGEPVTLRSSFAGFRAVKSKVPMKRLRELAMKAGIPAPDSGEVGAWQDSDAQRVLQIAFTDEGLDRHGTVFPAKEWTFRNYMKNPIALFNHGGNLPLGTTLLIEQKRILGNDGKRRDGWVAHVLFSREELNPEAEMAFRNVVAGRIRGASHSFDPVSVRLSNEKESKNMGISRDTPLISADLLEVSPVLIGSNPNAGPGRNIMSAQVRAIAGFRTEDGKGILGKDALEAIYGEEGVRGIEFEDVEIAEGQLTWEEMERAAAYVDTEMANEIKEFEPENLTFEDDPDGRFYEPGDEDSNEDPADPDVRSIEDELLSLLDEEDSNEGEPNEGREVEIDGVRYVEAGTEEVELRRRQLLAIAARALVAATQDVPGEITEVLQIGDLEEIRESVQTIREIQSDMRATLTAMDPLGSSGGGQLAEDALIDGLEEDLRKIAEGAK